MELITTLIDEFEYYWPAQALMRLVGEPLFSLSGHRAQTRFDLARVKSVLVVRTDEIGDVILTTPFLRELRRNLPNAWITLVVKPAVYNLVETCPYADEIFPFGMNTSKRSMPLRRYFVPLRFARRHLWKRHFDLAVLPRWDIDTFHATFLAYFSGAAWRAGFSEMVNNIKRYHNHNFNLLLTQISHNAEPRHEVEHGLDLLRLLGGVVREEKLELWPNAEDDNYAKQMFACGATVAYLPTDVVAIAPGAGHPRRRWPVEKFAELGRWLREDLGKTILLVGGPDETNLGRQLERELGEGVINQVGKTTLRQTAALIKRCRLFVGNDSGPMHMAVAMGVPVVEVCCHPNAGSAQHLNSPIRFGPWQVTHVVIQPEQPLHPCTDACLAQYAHCIGSISVERVKRAITAQTKNTQCQEAAF